MPPTPSGTRLPLATTSATVPLSCPDGLAHALSEQNLRLQQIVHEAKVYTIYAPIHRRSGPILFYHSCR